MPAPSPATSAECPSVAETVSEVAAFKRDRQRAEVHGLRQVLRVRLRQAALPPPEISPLPSKDEKLDWLGWMMGAE